MSYELIKNTAGQFYFNLKAANGEVILTSESYTAKASALVGIDSVRANAPHATSYEHKKSSANQPFFVLKAANSEVIGTSQMYSSEAARDQGIVSVQKNCGGPTKDLA